ncbi:MAG: hypothetical protein KDA89_20530, partial [Planctomycetaceae bacterium]|nr:hypothetical protein [Planctomycetaceae bacterium]
DNPVNAAANADVVRSERLHVTDSWGTMVIGDSATQTWHWASSLDHVAGDDWTKRLTTHVAGIAEPFSVRLDAPDSGWTADVLGSTLFRCTPDAPHVPEIADGRILFRASGPGERRTITAGFSAGGSVFRLSFGSDSQGIAVQVAPPDSAIAAESADESAAFRELPFGFPAVVTVYAGSADASLQRNTDEEIHTIPRGSLLRWTTSSDAPDAVDSSVMPEWVFHGAQPTAEVTSEMMRDMADRLSTFESVSGAVLELSADRNAQVAAYAVRLPALTRNTEELSALLLQSETEAVRREAIRGLRQIIRQLPDGRRRITSALEKRLSEAELEPTVFMLEGVSRIAAEDPQTCADLVGLLDSKRTAIRELAIFNLEELTGERHGYFAGDDSGRRDAAVRRWKRTLDRNDGLLLPR